MLTITEELLKAFPQWKKAGWKVGEQVNIVSYFQNEIRDNVNFHPPKRPGG